MSEREMTPEQKRWVKRLTRVLEDMPDDLWLFVNGAVNVMQRGANGERVMSPGFGGGVDPDYCVRTIPCECDGGGW